MVDGVIRRTSGGGPKRGLVGPGNGPGFFLEEFLWVNVRDFHGRLYMYVSKYCKRKMGEGRRRCSGEEERRRKEEEVKRRMIECHQVSFHEGSSFSFSWRI